MTNLTKRIVATIMTIPSGYVASYGQVARIAGNDRGARQVSWTLKSQSNKFDMPWQRVISSAGKISIPDTFGAMVQQNLLEKEGVTVGPGFSIDLKTYTWKPTYEELLEIDLLSKTIETSGDGHLQ